MRATGIEPLALYELCVAPDGNGRGLTGSGMFIVNPPWKLGEDMASRAAVARARARRRRPRVVSRRVGPRDAYGAGGSDAR